MTKEEVIHLLEKRETHKVEYKPSLSDTDRIIEVVCSFANAKGGAVLIGIKEENGKIGNRVVGIDIGKDTIGRLVNRIIDKTDPPIYPGIEVVKVFGKDVIVIEVTEGKDKPYTASGRPFIRIGDVTKQMKRSEYEGLLLEKNKEKLRFDTQTCDEADRKDIDEEKVRWFLRKASAERRLDIDDSLPIEEVLMRLKLTIDGKLTNLRVPSSQK